MHKGFWSKEASVYILRHTSKLTLCPILAKELLYVIVYSSLRYLINYSYRQTTTLYLHRQSHMACNVRRYMLQGCKHRLSLPMQSEPTVFLKPYHMIVS